jgi:hypothetical protein
MADPASRKQGGNVIGRPIEPVEVKNPKGRNQYSYKRAVEVEIDRLLGGELASPVLRSSRWVRGFA